MKIIADVVTGKIIRVILCRDGVYVYVNDGQDRAGIMCNAKTVQKLIAALQKSVKLLEARK